MKPITRNLLAAFLLLVVVGGLISIATNHAGPTKGAKWALDCRARMDLYALKQKGATPAYLQSVSDYCANAGQQVDDGQAPVNVAGEIAKWESTTTTSMGWGTAYKH